MTVKLLPFERPTPRTPEPEASDATRTETGPRQV